MPSARRLFCAECATICRVSACTHDRADTQELVFLYHSIPLDRIGWCAWAKLNTPPDRSNKSSSGGHLCDLDTTHACPQTYITSQKDCLATSPSRKITLCTTGSVAPRHGSSGTLLAAEKGCEGRKKTTFPDTSMSPKSVVDAAGTLIYKTEDHRAYFCSSPPYNSCNDSCLGGPSGDSRRLSKLKVTSYDTDYIRNRNSFQSGHFFEAAPARVNSNKAFVSRITTGVATSLDSALCQVSVFVLL